MITDPAAGILKRVTLSAPHSRLYRSEPMRRSAGKRVWGAPASAGEAVPGPQVDFPAPGETVFSSAYSIRVTSRAEGAVEISLDGGPWLPCRRAGGHWWHDWSGFAAGRHHLAVRSRLPNGRTTRSERTTFSVVL